MNARVLLRLLGGAVVVLATVAVLTAHLNTSKGVVTSVSAQVQADRVPVGSAYAGTVEQAVAVGQAVRAGEQLFVVDSAVLRHDQAIGLVQVGGTTAADGRLAVLSAVDGTVVDVTAGQGAFVQAGSELATVERTGSRAVAAELQLTPEQFGRLEPGAEATLTLPDGRTLPGLVDRIEVTTADAVAHVTVRVTGARLAAAEDDPLLVTGSPLEATVALRNDGVVTSAVHAVREWADGVVERVREVVG